MTLSYVSPYLATEIIYQKYYMGVPLYRQEKVLILYIFIYWKILKMYINEIYKVVH